MNVISRVVALAVLAVGSVGCVVDIPEPLEAGRTYEIGLQGAWTAEERAELAGACEDWGTWTGGRLSCVVSDHGADGAFVRAGTGVDVYGKIDAWDRRLVIDADGMYAAGFGPRSGVRAMAANLLGQAAQMELHEADCGVLSASCLQVQFVEADRSSCRAAGFCE